MNTVKSLSHESLNRVEKIKLPSEKSFGFTFAAVFFILGISPFLLHLPLRFVFILLSVIFFACALLRPAALKQTNLLWFKFGLLLNKIVSPLVLLLLFVTAFIPTGLLLRLFKKDILKLKINKNVRSYWVDSPVSDLTSMKEQF